MAFAFTCWGRPQKRHSG